MRIFLFSMLLSLISSIFIGSCCAKRVVLKGNENEKVLPLFGSDSRNQNAGRLAYSKAVAKKCNLKKEDFYIPKRVVEKI